MKYLSPVALGICVSLLISVINIRYQLEHQKSLTAARYFCDRDQQDAIDDYTYRTLHGTWPAAIDPPATYCGYLETVQPDILLKRYPPLP